MGDIDCNVNIKHHHFYYYQTDMMMMCVLNLNQNISTLENGRILYDDNDNDG